MYFISAAVILLASLALIVQGSLPYNKTGRTSVMYSLMERSRICVLFKTACNFMASLLLKQTNQSEHISFINNTGIRIVYFSTTDAQAVGNFSTERHRAHSEQRRPSLT